MIEIHFQLTDATTRSEIDDLAAIVDSLRLTRVTLAELSERQRELLQLLLASDDESSEFDREDKRQIAELKRLRLVETRAGRGGGTWLTPRGRSLAEQI
jgi:hypothetical protein